MSLLGIDIGSSQCKAVAFSPGGEIVATATHEYAPTFPAPGRAEMDPRLFWDAFGAVTRAVARQLAHDPVSALAISSHGETFFPAGADGEPIGPAIYNIDTRAAAEAREFEERIGRRALFRITGLVAHPMFPLPKMAWLRRHAPESFGATARFVSVIDYIMHRLGVTPAIDLSLASRFMAFDVRARRWSPELLALAGLTADGLPAPVPAGTVAGRLRRTVAADLGLSPTIPVVVGGHDQPVGALGSGAVAPGMVSDSAGTYECLLAAVEAPSLDDVALEACLNSACHVLPGLYQTIAYFPSGIMVKWFADLFADGDGQAFYRAMEAGAPAGPSGLTITPHLIGSCVPSFDPRATGVVVGLSPTTDRYALYKGVLEGVACELAVITALLARAVGRVDALRVYGGGARSRLGVQLRAALTGCRIELMQSREAVCLGTAMLAGVASGVYAGYAEAAAQAVAVADTVVPDPAWVAAYQPQLARYQALYPALEAVRAL